MAKTVILKSWGLFIPCALHEGMISQNVLVIRGLCCRVCELQLFCMNVNVAVFLATCAGDVDRSVYCACETNNFLGNVS
jgi:hypothetical protein